MKSLLPQGPYSVCHTGAAAAATADILSTSMSPPDMIWAKPPLTKKA